MLDYSTSNLRYRPFDANNIKYLISYFLFKQDVVKLVIKKRKLYLFAIFFLFWKKKILFYKQIIYNQ